MHCPGGSQTLRVELRTTTPSCPRLIWLRCSRGRSRKKLRRPSRGNRVPAPVHQADCSCHQLYGRRCCSGLMAPALPVIQGPSKRRRYSRDDFGGPRFRRIPLTSLKPASRAIGARRHGRLPRGSCVPCQCRTILGRTSPWTSSPVYLPPTAVPLS